MCPKTGGSIGWEVIGIHREVTFPERERVAVLMMKCAEVPLLILALAVFMAAFLLMLVV